MRFDDRLSNVVYFADVLPTRYPAVYSTAKLNLESNGIKVKLIKTVNIWVRDFMPLQVGDHFVKFVYKKSRKYPWLDVDERVWGFMAPTHHSDLILDGGGIIRGDGKFVVTEKVFRDNREWKKGQVISALEYSLEGEAIILPIEPEDTLGHADGICKFVDEKTILINDYSSVFEKDPSFKAYMKEVVKRLEKSNLNVELLPYAYGEWNWKMSEKEFRVRYPLADEYNPGYGYYINFLLVMGVILAPVMGIRMDVDVIKTLRRLYPGYNVIAVDCSKLSMEGGLMNCVTINYIERGGRDVLA